MLMRQMLSLFLLLGLMTARAATPALTLDGDLRQGGLVFGQAPPGTGVLLDGEALRVDARGRFLLGFDRDAASRAELTLKLPDGRLERRELRIAARDYDVQRIDGLPQRKVSPRSAEDLARIRRDAALVRQARERDDDRADFSSGFLWPARGRISGVYGSQRILNGEPRRPHYGVDIAAPVGSPVRAPAAGIVTLAEPDLFFSGGTLILDHGHALSSTFLHLSRLLVEVGDRVEQGELIAEIGATGRVTGPHLDWRMDWRGRKLDPQPLAGPLPGSAADRD